jgi:predicted Co/Zn/Cd cation transporter (cation efflux family)
MMNRQVGVLLAAAGVGAGFVIVIGTGFRLTDPEHSPISDGVYFAAIGVLVAMIAFGVYRILQNRGPSRRTVESWTLDDLVRMTEKLQRDDAARARKN